MTNIQVHSVASNFLRKRLKDIDITTLDALGTISVAFMWSLIMLGTKKELEEIFEHDDQGLGDVRDVFDTACFILDPLLEKMENSQMPDRID